jgi:hypothetical protein
MYFVLYHGLLDATKKVVPKVNVHVSLPDCGTNAAKFRYSVTIETYVNIIHDETESRPNLESACYHDS